MVLYKHVRPCWSMDVGYVILLERAGDLVTTLVRGLITPLTVGA